MPPPMRFVLLASTLSLLASAQAARADMYTWVDAAGRVNVSNVAPPEGVRVTNVRHDVAPPPPDPAWQAARAAEREREMQALADRARELEVQALTERVRSLEREVEFSQRRAAAPVAYDYPPPVPQAIQYVAETPQLSGTCDPSWAGCWWNPGWYSGGVVVVGVPGYRRYNAFHGGYHGGARYAPSRPGRGGGGSVGGAPPRRR